MNKQKASSIKVTCVAEKPNFSLIDEALLKSKIHTIRGVKVMLDADLAEIYGYTTKAFNQQVKNNIEKFAEDFRFQITRKEYREILGSKFLTLEQGIYKHMIVLKSLKRKSEPFCINPGSYIIGPAIVITPLAKINYHIVGTLAFHLS